MKLKIRRILSSKKYNFFVSLKRASERKISFGVCGVRKEHCELKLEGLKGDLWKNK